MFKRTILAASVAALTFTGVAQAQKNATLTLRSGERINAQLVDLGGRGIHGPGQRHGAPDSDERRVGD